MVRAARLGNAFLRVWQEGGYQLVLRLTAAFSRRGLRAVGVNEVIERSNVAKATFYRHFPSKDDLILAFLDQREELWSRGWVLTEAKALGETPEQQLLAIFDLFGEWFAEDDYTGCFLINVLLEIGDRHNPISQASSAILARTRAVIATLADEAGLRGLEEFALSWHILMKDSIVQAAEGDLEAATRAQTMGRLLIAHHR